MLLKLVRQPSDEVEKITEELGGVASVRGDDDETTRYKLRVVNRTSDKQPVKRYGVEDVTEPTEGDNTTGGHGR